MTYDETVKYLSRYRMAVAVAVELLDEIVRWRSIAEKITPSTSSAPGGGDCDGSRMERAVERIQDIIQMLDAQLISNVKLRMEMERMVGALADERLQRIMRLRYVEGLTFEKIAVKMNYSYRQTRRLHAKAVMLAGRCP